MLGNQSKNTTMEALKKAVHELTETNDNPVPYLQKINEEILKNYQISIDYSLTIIPKVVEIYYVNYLLRTPFVDTNMHCMTDMKKNAEIWALQSDRFGQLYIHLKGRGGIDICLSDSKDYALCCTLKAATINGEEIWSALKIRDTLLEHIGKQTGNSLPVQHIIGNINSPHSPVILTKREHSSDEFVYHVRRQGLRRNDKNTRLHLRSFTDLWNKKQPINNIDKVNLYMTIHPDADILTVMREQHFRYIPYPIRIKYKISAKAKL